MKINKFTGLVKKRGMCYWINTDSGVYLGTQVSMYNAQGLPQVNDKGQVQTILDFDQKTRDKVAVDISYIPRITELRGVNMCNEVLDDDVRAERMYLAAVVDGVQYAALLDDDGELIFFDERFLAPIADILKDDYDYIQYYIRKNHKGEPYIIIKNGLMTVAAVSPMRVLSEGYLAELKKFSERCKKQFAKEQAQRMITDGENPSQNQLGEESGE